MTKAFKFSAPLVAVALILMTGASSAYGKGPRGLATVTGTVRDHRGMPLAGALVQIIGEGARKVVKEARTAADGNFSTKIPAGRYSLKAVANGFSEVLFSSVTVAPSAEIAYRFNLEPLGAGRTYPEQRNDRDSAKWRLRSAQTQRSIFQANENPDSTVGAVEASVPGSDDVSIVNASSDQDNKTSDVRPQGVVETYFAESAGPFSSGYQGLNFAVALRGSESVNFIFVGQTGTGSSAPQRFETTALVRLNDRHRLGVTAGGAKVNSFAADPGSAESLGQMSVRAVDEWIVRDGLVVVMGLDYSRFFGAGHDSVLTPRLGLQFDAGPRMRVKAAYARVDDSADLQSVANFESCEVTFKGQAIRPVAYVSGRAVMARSRRFEVGLERELSNRASVEATAFVDTTSGRGVGLLAMPATAFSGDSAAAFIQVANQQGSARGVRVVYSNRLNHVWNASAGYSFGRGQRLSSGGISNPAQMFDGAFFNSFAVQLAGDWATGTHVQTVFRFSPEATVFAIDPFAGQLAVYDPSLSIQVTQDLPTFGLPVRAQAILDARNLLDVQTTVSNGETLLLVGSHGRSVRGGISVRF